MADRTFSVSRLPGFSTIAVMVFVMLLNLPQLVLRMVALHLVHNAPRRLAQIMVLFVVNFRMIAMVLLIAEIVQI